MYLVVTSFGGAAVVNKRSGLALFGGSIIWDGAGEITYPESWRSPVELGEDCTPYADPVRTTGYDLVSGATLAMEDADAALDAIRGTAIFEAFWNGGYLFDATVLRYPRSVGAFDPSSAEWIVIVHGGFLE